MGIGCMAMAANMQFGWTLFVDPIDQKYHWGRAAIQLAFTIFIFTETWLGPIEGWFVDRYGPRIVIVFGGFVGALAWVVNSYADSLFMLYVGAILGGIGAGSVFGTCVGNAQKWFPDRRGLAAGATAFGFGAGSAVTIIPIAQMIASRGYEAAFFNFGVGQGIVIVVLGLFMTKPLHMMQGVKKKLHLPQSTVNYTPVQTLRSSTFWLLYVIFALVAVGGLTAASQIGPIAHDYKIAGIPVSLFGLQMATLTFAISLDRIFDGFGRPIFGMISDFFGRENTMFVAFGTGAAMLWLLSVYGHNPVVFVIAMAVYFGAFGEIYSLFPATMADTFGPKYTTTNIGMLYTAKGMAALLVPVGSLLAKDYGWETVFTIGVVFNVVAALLALFVLKPLRSKQINAREPTSDAAVRHKPTVVESQA
jgi:OFA family oxalate/formate antiporter-like MFS transporter